MRSANVKIWCDQKSITLIDISEKLSSQQCTITWTVAQNSQPTWVVFLWERPSQIEVTSKDAQPIHPSSLNLARNHLVMSDHPEMFSVTSRNKREFWLRNHQLTKWMSRFSLTYAFSSSGLVHCNISTKHQSIITILTVTDTMPEKKSISFNFNDALLFSTTNLHSPSLSPSN